MSDNLEKPRRAPKNAEDRHIVTALLRGLDVLRCFTVARTELTTVEIAKLIGLPQPTVWRLCNTLISGGYLAMQPGTSRLRVSPQVLSLGTAAIHQVGYLEAIKPDLQGMADEFSGAVSLAMPERDGLIILQRCLSSARMTLNLAVGSVFPVEASALGWAYFVAMTKPEQRATLKLVKARTGDDWPVAEQNLNRSVESYEQDGYVYNSGHTKASISAIAAPVIMPKSGKIFVVGCAGASDDLSQNILHGKLAPAVLELRDTLLMLIPDA